MPLALAIGNRQQIRAVDWRLFRRMVAALLSDLLEVQAGELGVVLVAAPEITRLNEAFLRHAGVTDVIAFDYSPTAIQERRAATRQRLGLRQPSATLERTLAIESGRGLPHSKTSRKMGRFVNTTVQGEIFLCVDEAVRQARRYRTSWQVELIRYVTHGVLHLLGFDDHTAATRRRMKRAEDDLLRRLAARFPLSRLARKPKLPS